MINLINMTYEKMFCLYLLEVSPLLEIDRMLNQIMGHVIDDEFNLSLSKDKFDTIEITDNTEKKYEIGSSFLGLCNFRLLSRAHAERLQESDIRLFEIMIKENKRDDFERALNIVRNTFRRVMCVNPDEAERMTCLGPYPDESFCFDDDSIVLGLVIDKADIPEKIISMIQSVALNMKRELFEKLSSEIDAKVELYVSVE